jgi:hypothetical protein
MSKHTRKHRTRETPYGTPSVSNKKSLPWREVFEEGIEKFSEVGLMLGAGP